MALGLKHFLLIFFLVLVDQFSKFLVSFYVSKPVVLTFFLKLVFVRNSGVAFGLLDGFGARWFLVLFSIVVIFFLLGYSRNQKDEFFLCVISFIIAGAFGNMFDRVLFGGVVDFISVGWWPAFNVADGAITIGIFGFFLAEIRKK